MDYKLILQKMLFKKDSPNLILSGTDKIDKLSILSEYLTKIDKTPPLSLEKYNIKWISNTTYKIFDMNLIKYKHSDNLFEIINEIISSKNYYNNFNRIVVLKGFNNVNINIQNKFRVIFEKFRGTTLFILITSRLTSIIGPILSRFLLIRVSDITPKEKRTISREYIKELSYDKKSIIYDKIYSLANEIDIIFYSQFNEGILVNHQSIFDKIYQKIRSINTINKKTLSEIRSLSYMIEKYNLDNFHRELYISFLNDLTLSFSVQSKICKLITDCESNYHKSFNTILSIENCIISFIHILSLRTGSR
jgi:DNA polymerase III delta prime subunit